MTSVKEELSKLKSAFAGIQQDLHKVRVLSFLISKTSTIIDNCISTNGNTSYIKFEIE